MPDTTVEWDGTQYPITPVADSPETYEVHDQEGNLLGQIKPRDDGQFPGAYWFRRNSENGWTKWHTQARTVQDSAAKLLKEIMVPARRRSTDPLHERKRKPKKNTTDKSQYADRPIKAIPYAPDREPDEYDPSTRWAIVDTETGEILDNAQGYGYKSPQAAHRAWGYKTMTPVKKRQRENVKQHVQAWLRKNHTVNDWLNDAMFEAAKNGEQISKEDVQYIIDQSNVDLEGLTISQIMRYW